MATTSELALFLRARREGLSPAEVGLSVNGRRRTPGLRREELATLAGVSIDYLVRLEQGRDTNPSPAVLAALAAALQLTPEERGHLGMLAVRGHAGELCPGPVPPVTSVPATVQSLLDRLDPTPAFVLGPTNDVLAWNHAWAELVRPLGLLDGTPPNTARFVFLDDRSRRAYTDWASAADEQVRQLRAAGTYWNWETGYQSLVADLSGVEEFDRRWAAHAIAAKRRGTELLRHPKLGVLRFDYEALLVGDDVEQRLVTWLPADEATTAALAPASGPPQLRVVGKD
ncbi:MAG: transcriptional regulator [Acidimicrobiales bacterium]|nr:transcriptional regulator [Acidimicrobiales bacterium]